MQRVYRSGFRYYTTALARIRRKHKVAIVIGFYGREYSGMQVNDQKSSIEDCLISKLYSLGKIEFFNVIKPTKFDWERCSRTDKGVSAKRIVISGKMMDYDDEFSSDFHNDVAVSQLNQLLPKDIRVFSYTKVSNRFNPHLNAYSRQYLYYLPIDLYKQAGVSIDEALFSSTIQQFEGTHYMKNYTGSIHHRNKDLRQFYLRTMFPSILLLIRNSIHVKPRLFDSQRFLEISLNGNSFLYHQIRKMIGASIAVACYSWTPRYFQSSFDTPSLAVPIAPGTPLCLDSVSFRNDKNIFLDKKELQRVEKKGRRRPNANPNRKYDTLLLLRDCEEKKAQTFFEEYTVPHILHDIQKDTKEMTDFIKHLHIGQCYDIR